MTTNKIQQYPRLKTAWRFRCVNGLATLLFLAIPVLASANPFVNVVDDFGAVGDGTGNDAPAINNAINYCRVNALPNGNLPKLVFPPGTYRVTEPIDLTQISKFFVVDFQGSTILAALGGPVIDMGGSSYCHLWHCRIESTGAGIKANFGILMGRLGDNTPARGNVLRDVTIEGHFTQAALANYAGEKLTCYNLKLDNRESAAGGAWALALHSTNIPGSTNNPQTRHFRFYGGSFKSASGTGVISLNSASNVVIYNCHIQSSGSSGIVADSTNGAISGLELSNFSTGVDAASPVYPQHFLRFAGTGGFNDIWVQPGGPVGVKFGLLGLSAPSGSVKLTNLNIQGDALNETLIPKPLIRIINGDHHLENATLRASFGSTIDLAGAKSFHGAVSADTPGDISLNAGAQATVTTADRTFRISGAETPVISGGTVTISGSRAKIANSGTMNFLYMANAGHGEEVWLTAASNVTVKHNAVGTNRILTASGANKTINASKGIKLKWDVSLSRWIED